MYNGKYQKPAAGKTGRKKPAILIISLVLLIAAAIGGTVAYLMDSTNEVTNTFTPVKAEITINENKTDTVKENISFTNSDDAVPVYVRATLVVYWTNGKGETIAKPKDADFTMGTIANSSWFQVGNIYYYAPLVNPGETTAVMLTPITVSIPAGSDAVCHVDVRAEAIQAEPASAVEAWKDVRVVNGRLTAK